MIKNYLKVFVGVLLVLFTINGAMAQSINLTENIVAYYKFDENTSTTASNSVSGSFTGTLNGGASWITGYINSGVSLDGTDDYVVVGKPLGDSPSGNKTVSLWVRKPVLSSAGYVYSTYSSSTGGFSMYTNSAGRMAISWTTSPEVVNTGSFVLTENTWHHIVAVYSAGTNGGKIYVDGVLRGQGNLGTESSGSLNLKFGGRWDGTSSGGTGNGAMLRVDIDEISIYTDAKNESFISDLYNVQSNTSLSNDYRQYPFSSPPSPPGTDYFTFNAYDLFSNSSITNFSVSIDTIGNFTTTNGSIIVNATQLNGTYDVGYFGGFYSENFSGVVINSTASFNPGLTRALFKVEIEDLFNNPLSGGTYFLSNGSFTSSTYNTSVFNPMNVGSWTLTVSKAGFYSFSDSYIQSGDYPFESQTLVGLTDNRFTLLLKSIVDNSTITNFTGTLYQYSEGYTESFSSTNGSFTFELMQGFEYFIELDDVEGYANNFNNNYTFTPNNMSGSHILYLYTDNSIRFFIYDEDNNSLITENITIIISGDPYEQTLYTANGTIFVENIPDGTYNIKLFNANYTERTYLTTVSNKSTQELNAYLTQQQNSVTFTTLDGSSSTALSTVAITMYRVINNTWISVESKLTDITGRAVFNYVTNTNYRFIASKTGYQDKIFNLDPIIFEFYNVRLDKEYITDVQLDYSNIYINFNPKRFFNDAQNNISYMIQSPEGKLSNYYLNVSYPGGYQYFTGSNSIGEQFFIQFNITGATINDEVRLEYGYTSVLGDNKTFSDVFRIERSPSSMSWNKKVDRTYGLGVLELSLISVFFALLISGIGVMIGGGIVGGLLGLLTLAFFTFLGFIPLWSILISVFVGFMIILGRSR